MVLELFLQINACAIFILLQGKKKIVIMKSIMYNVSAGKSLIFIVEAAWKVLLLRHLLLDLNTR